MNVSSHHKILKFPFLPRDTIEIAYRAQLYFLWHKLLNYFQLKDKHSTFQYLLTKQCLWTSYEKDFPQPTKQPNDQPNERTNKQTNKRSFVAYSIVHKEINSNVVGN